MTTRLKLFLWMFGLLWLGSSRPAFGAAFTPPQNPPRFVFIVEKSDHTQALGLDLPQTMFDLVYHGANGYLPNGGVFEIWVFGEDTIYRGFKPEMLMPSNHLPLASKASAYVRGANSGGLPDVAKMAGNLRNAGEMATELTVILVTAPDTRLTGTGIDTDLNSFYSANAETQTEAKRAFITTLRIQDRKIVAWRVSDSPFTMVMPSMPVSPLPLGERERMVDEARKARYDREHPPVAAVAKPVENLVSKTDESDRPDDQRDGAIILRGSPTKESPPAAPPKTELVEKTAAPVEAAPPKPSTLSPGTVTQGQKTLVDRSASSQETPKAKTVSEPVAVLAAPPVDNSPGIKRGNVTTNDSTSSEAVTKGPAAPAIQPAESTNSLKTSPQTNELAAKRGVSPETAVALPDRPWFTVGGLFVIGLGFFLVAALLGWVLMRRTRNVAGPSYITRSIQDSRKDH